MENVLESIAMIAICYLAASMIHQNRAQFVSIARTVKTFIYHPIQNITTLMVTAATRPLHLPIILIYIFSFFTGSHFGTTFPHLFFQAFPETIKVVEPNIYVAKLFGFRISGLSAVGPRMQWLRMVKDKPAATAADGEEDEDANEMAV